MKQPWEWEEEDIEALIRDEVQENLNLDYKQCASLDRRDLRRNIELSKDVSSFANSASGTLIYGVVEKNHLPEKIDSGYDPTEVTREWIDQVIISTIHPRIDGVRIKQIELKKNNPGRVIYVVYVPQGRVAHMAADNRYWKRFEYNAAKMEDYEVRDTNRRNEAPDLHLAYYIDEPEPILLKPQAGSYFEPIKINLRIKNNSPTPAMYSVFRLYIDKSIKVTSQNGELVNNPTILLNVPDKTTYVMVWSINHSIPGNLPLWETLPSQLFAESPLFAFSNGDATYTLVWEAYSVGMAPRYEIYTAQVQGATLSLKDHGVIYSSLAN